MPRSGAGRADVALRRSMHLHGRASSAKVGPRVTACTAGPGRIRMKATSLVTAVRWLGSLVLILMAVAVVYAGFTAISYWPSIRV